jgi:MFS transporter, DHA3 family, macrolide efflux protein
MAQAATMGNRRAGSKTTPFFVMWTGQAFSLIGSQLVQFALVWWLTSLTGSATVLALATLMALIPQVAVSPLAGALVDRWNRRTVMIVADGAVALTTVALVVLFATGNAQVWHVYAALFIRALGGAFHWPAMQASTSLMVPEEWLSRIAGLNQSLQGLAGIVAPPLGALLLAALPMTAVLSVDIITAALAIAPLCFIAVPQPTTSAAKGAGGSVMASMKEGLRFVWHWPGAVSVVGIAMLINLLVTPAAALQPLLVTQHFHGGAMQLAWLQSAMGLGMVAGGLLLGAWGGLRNRMLTGLLALALAGVGFLAVGLAPTAALPLAIGGMAFAGIMMPIANGSFFALLQSVVPADMQGRVFTLVMSGCGIMSPLGLAIAGPAADALGVQIWYVVGGVATILLAIVSLANRAVMHMDRVPVVAAAASVGEAQAL